MKRNSALAILFITIFIDLLGFGIVIPILPNYCREIGASKFMVGVIMAVFSLMQFLFTPFWGKLSDKYGRRPIIIISTLISTIAYLVFSYAVTIPLMILSRAFSGMGSGNISAAQAYISDITPPEKRAQSMGLIGAAFGLGFSIGPFLGGIIKAELGFEYIGYIVAGLCVLNFVLAMFLLPESLKEKSTKPFRLAESMVPVDKYVQVMKTPGKRELFLIYFIFTLAFLMFQSTAAMLWSDEYHYDDKEVSYIFSFIGISTAIIQGVLVGIMNKRFSEFSLIRTGNIIFMISLLLVPFIPGNLFVPLGLVVLFGMALGNGMAWPSSLSVLSKMTDKHQQGQTLGLFQSFGSVGRVVGPLIGGALYEFGTVWPYVAGSVIIIANLVLVKYVAAHFMTRRQQLESAEDAA